MTEYKHYSEYKDSGVEWLGEIPVEWKLVSGKKVINTHKHIVGEKHNEYQRLSLTMDGVLPKSKLTADGLSPESFSTYQILCAGELVFKMIDLENRKTSRVGLSYDNGLVSSAYIVATTKSNFNEKFAYYYYISLYNQGIYNFLGSGVRSTLNSDDMKEIPVSLPPLGTQHKIVEFLDAETAHIDGGIANMESLITLLTEKRSALISEVVTRGIPGEHAEFKDSGVEWLGEIPVGWKIVSGKKVISTHKEIVGDRQEDYQRLSLTMNGVLPKSKTTAGGLSPESFNTYQIVRSGEFIFKMIDLENRKTSRVGLSHDTGLVSSAYIVASPKLGFDKTFGYYYYTALYNEGIYNFLGSGVRSTLNADDMKNIPVCLPPIETQQKIVEFLRKETAQLDSVIAEVKNGIKLLKEKRQTLISDVVTGKIDVRNSVN